MLYFLKEFFGELAKLELSSSDDAPKASVFVLAGFSSIFDYLVTFTSYLKGLEVMMGGALGHIQDKV